ncbi:MAG: hypothetical protein J5503_00320 [Muribaculaceae bacterium]|nr:hypothetical protein [Muribaculaceae bacterium]
MKKDDKMANCLKLSLLTAHRGTIGFDAFGSFVAVSHWDTAEPAVGKHFMVFVSWMRKKMYICRLIMCSHDAAIRLCRGIMCCIYYGK